MAIKPMGFGEAIRYGIAEHIKHYREVAAEERQYAREHPHEHPSPGYTLLVEEYPLQSTAKLTPAIREVAGDILNAMNARDGRPHDAARLAETQAESETWERFNSSLW